MRLVAFIGAMVAGLGLLGTVGYAGGAGLDGRSIKQLFPGYFEAQVQGYRVEFTGSGNGTLQGIAYGRQDQGRWFVKGNSLCVSWKQWTKGQAKCGLISQQGGWFVASAGGKEVLKFRRSMLAQQ
ncbi:MAG: hypothetical protein HY245_13515 [Rhizobiales bacterium]|nr:hypothetical protein [Hyphomicrobiales bacterium]MBI3674408.1 hypothetical protein [Hyphomicrobiales bacterium]